MSYVTAYRGGMSQIPPGFLEVAAQSGKSLGDGIADFADHIARAQEEVDNRHKAENLAAKSAEMFRKSLELSKPEGVDIPDPVQFANLDARGKAAWAQSTVASLHAAQQAQAMKESQQRMALAQGAQEMQRESLKRSALDAELFNKAGRAMMQTEAMGDGEQGPPRLAPITPELAIGTLSKFGQLDNPEAANLLRNLVTNQAHGGSAGDIPREVTIGGNSFVYQGHTLLPNPKRENNGLVPLHDPATGELIGHGVPNLKTGAMTVIRSKQAGAGDLLKYEEALGNLDGQIAYQQKLKGAKDSRFDANALDELTQRRKFIRSEYMNAFGGKGAPAVAPDGAADPVAAPAPAAAAPAKSANPVWRNGKLVFPK